MKVEPLDDPMVDTRDPFEADAENNLALDLPIEFICFEKMMAHCLAILVDGDPYEGHEAAYVKACWQLVADVRAEQKRER